MIETVGIRDAVESTLKILEQVEVKGKDNITAMSLAMSNLTAIVDAYKKFGSEVKHHESDDQQGKDV